MQPVICTSKSTDNVLIHHDISVKCWDTEYREQTHQCNAVSSSGSGLLVTGFSMLVMCMHSPCFGVKECIYFNMSSAQWTTNDSIDKVRCVYVNVLQTLL